MCKEERECVCIRAARERGSGKAVAWFGLKWLISGGGVVCSIMISMRYWYCIGAVLYCIVLYSIGAVLYSILLYSIGVVLYCIIPSVFVLVLQCSTKQKKTKQNDTQVDRPYVPLAVFDRSYLPVLTLGK